MAEDTATLTVFYEGWHTYQKLLTDVLAPLSEEQLTLRVTPQQRSIAENAIHMISARARWFYRMMNLGGETFADMSTWDRPGKSPHSAAELVEALDTSWRIMQEIVTSWTPEDMQVSYTRDEQTITRQWVIWHLIEHDLHHGGEISLTLGMHGLQAPDM